MNLTIEEAIKRLKVPGTNFTGCDWTYGWPHKFRIDSDKVYNEQLKTATPELVKAWDEVTGLFFGIHFFTDTDGRVKFSCRYHSPFYGYQRAGVVGENGQPIRSDTWNADYGTN